MTITRSVLRESWQAWLYFDLRDPPEPAWLQWVWTFLVCAAIAAGFTVWGVARFGRDEGWPGPAAWAAWYGRSMVISLTIGVVTHLLFEGLRRTWVTPARAEGWRPWQRGLFFIGVPVVGVAVGWPLGLHFVGADLGLIFGTIQGRQILLWTLLVALLVSAGLHASLAAKAGEAEARRRATEAQLRLLQAQIEPHFLFNTLANVAALIDDDAPRARRMLESFTDYLRGSLGALRDGTGTLGDELALVHHYLQLQQVRMESRLLFDIDSDPALAGLPLPPLMLQPLVENAVRHGLEPQLDGGRVTVRARAEARQLVLEVADDGPGLAATPARPGQGVALANLRERLQALHGGGASLVLEDTAPGTRATIRLPLPALPR